MTPTDFLQAKSRGAKLSMVTCYDFTSAKLLASSPVDGILVGDSAAMVMHGHATTLTATIEMMQSHVAAVARGAGEKLVVADMPFLTFRKGIPAAMEAAHSLMTAGAHALKVEGVAGHEDVIERLVGSGIPVMGHVGLQPQSVNAYGGFKPQGRKEASASGITRDAIAIEKLGAFAVVIECVPAGLAQEITLAVKIPTIGIGAGAGCDGQILVWQDLLGMNSNFRPRFARRFCDGEGTMLEALTRFDEAVKSSSFPTAEESYS
jgi:3-methyl-2-oxobutanoate hydroxymethyltransferase